MSEEKKKDKGLYICPNNHMYNANKYGDTCPNCGAKQKDKVKTEKEYAQELTLAPNEWVCGWLVCIKGINKGRAYAIREGKNFIGSDPNMDIYIKGDLKIVPKNHAVIMYDAKARKTFLLGGVAQGMVYLDEQAVYEITDIAPFNKIEIGNSGFIYVTLCGSNFDWADISE